MSQSDSRRADGRLHRARRSMRKLLALNLTKDEVLDLFDQVKERRRPDAPDETGVPVPDGRDERLAQAQDLIRRLISLGFAECDIAVLSGLAPATITRTLDPHAGHGLGFDTFVKIYSVVEHAAAERLNALLPRVPLKVLETCCDKGVEINPVLGDRLETGIRSTLQAALLGVKAPDTLAPGIAGALVQIGCPEDDVVVVIAPRRRANLPEARLEQLRALEHETGHLQAHYRAERERLENTLGLDRDRVSPIDGRIA